MNIEQLIQIGGAEWKKNEMHRIYFNNLPSIYGLETELYNTGNIWSATLDGEKISNARAREIEACLNNSKVWFDVTTGNFAFKAARIGRYDGEELCNAVIETIKAKTGALSTEQVHA